MMAALRWLCDKRSTAIMAVMDTGRRSCEKIGFTGFGTLHFQ
jgi:hypothetical protein